MKKEISQLLFLDLAETIEQGKKKVTAQINGTLTLVYWQVGSKINTHILEEERAEYAGEIVASLSEKLVEHYGKSFELRNLRRMMQFSKVFPKLEIVSSLMTQLSWTHFIVLLPVKNDDKRYFYAVKSAEEGWSTRQLQYQIERKAYERKEIAQSQIMLESNKVSSSFKDPYILDFLDFHLDLLFYHRKLKRLVAIELKLENFKAAHKGQMELYLKWLDRYERQEGEEHPIGLILCAEKSNEQVELLEMGKNGIMVAEYWTELPPKDELEAKLHNAMFEARERLSRMRLGQ